LLKETTQKGCSLFSYGAFELIWIQISSWVLFVPIWNSLWW